VRHILATDDINFMVNRVIEVWDIGDFEIREMPSP
jgi:hypothetical protein